MSGFTAKALALCASLHSDPCSFRDLIAERSPYVGAVVCHPGDLWVSVLIRSSGDTIGRNNADGYGCPGGRLFFGGEVFLICDVLAFEAAGGHTEVFLCHRDDDGTPTS